MEVKTWHNKKKSVAEWGMDEIGHDQEKEDQSWWYCRNMGERSLALMRMVMMVMERNGGSREREGSTDKIQQ